jgi:hypothetical protein
VVSAVVYVSSSRCAIDVRTEPMGGSEQLPHTHIPPNREHDR